MFPQHLIHRTVQRYCNIITYLDSSFWLLNNLLGYYFEPFYQLLISYKILLFLAHIHKINSLVNVNYLINNYILLNFCEMKKIKDQVWKFDTY